MTTPAVDPSLDAVGTKQLNEDAAKTALELGARVINGIVYIAELEAKLKDAKKLLREIQEGTLVEAMSVAGIASFELPTGETINLESIVSASIPKADQDRAMAYLRDRGWEDVIKVDVTTVFKKGEHKDAMALLDQLKEEKRSFSFREHVHPQTFKAWVKEKVAKGVQLDHEILGIFVGLKAVVVGREPEEEQVNPIS